MPLTCWAGWKRGFRSHRRAPGAKCSTAPFPPSLAFAQRPPTAAGGRPRPSLGDSADSIKAAFVHGRPLSPTAHPVRPPLAGRPRRRWRRVPGVEIIEAFALPLLTGPAAALPGIAHPALPQRGGRGDPVTAATLGARILSNGRVERRSSARCPQSVRRTGKGGIRRTHCAFRGRRPCVAPAAASARCAGDPILY